MRGRLISSRQGRDARRELFDQEFVEDCVYCGGRISSASGKSPVVLFMANGLTM